MMRVDYAHHSRGQTMNTATFNSAAAKKSVNLSINADLLQQAKQLNINLSQTLELQLAALVRQAKQNQWLAENRPALDEYNHRIATNGTFSDGLRSF